MAFDSGLIALRPRRIPYAPLQSIQFNRANSSYLSKIFGIPTNDKKFTLIWWGKLTDVIGSMGFLRAYNSHAFYLHSDRSLRMHNVGTVYYTSTQVFRDPTAFGQWCIQYDSANATQANRIVVLYDNVAVAGGSCTLPINTTGFHAAGTGALLGYIGPFHATANDYADGAWTDIVLIDGEIVSPSVSGEYDTLGQWVPKRPSVATWGTNGFWLDGEMSDTSVLDKSGNNNHWTVHGVTECLDSPGDRASANVGNYARLSSIDKGTAATVSGAGLTLSINGANNIWGRATMPVGPGMKVYFEVDCVDQAEYRYISCGAIYDGRTGTIDGGSSGGGTFPTWGSGAQLAIAADHDAGTVAFYRSGALVATVTGVANLAPWVIQLAIGGTSDPSGVFNVRFDPGTFVFAPPEGFTPLCTAHMPAKAPKNPRAQMGVALYSADDMNGRQVLVDGLTSTPDLAIFKSRNIASAWRWFDSLRTPGIGNKELSSDGANVEGYQGSCGVHFIPGGVEFDTTVGTNNQPNEASASGNMVMLAIGGLTHMTAAEIAALVTATGATITPSAIAYDATLGFAMIRWTGNATAGAKIPHPLGQPPAMIISKDKASGVGHWLVYHVTPGATQTGILQSTNAFTTWSAWNNTAPTAGVLTVGGAVDENRSSGEYITYLFANTDAIKVGSYVGNGSTDGPFVDLGGEPAFFMTKPSSSAGAWSIADGARNPHNPVTAALFAESSTTESDGTGAGYNVFDFCSGGVKVRQNTAGINGSGYTIIYLAFLKSYFGGANVAQGRAR